MVPIDPQKPKSYHACRIPRHQRFRSAATEPLIAVEVDDSPAVPRVAVDRFGVRGFGD
jgi:hypothetical protein